MPRQDAESKHLLLILPVAAALQVVLLVRNVFFLPQPAATVMPVVQGVLVIALLWLWRWLARQKSPIGRLQRMVPALLIFVGLLLPLEQALTGNGMLAANLALVIVMGSALIIGRLQFGVFCVALVIGWMLAVSTRVTWSVTIADQATYVMLGSLIGLAVFLLRTADRRQLEAARDAAYSSAMRDPLTNLWNRRGLIAILPSMVGSAREISTGVWCLFMDVRGLKAVNDTRGHVAGDQLLTAVGVALESTEVFGGVPARWGGDEFCAIGVGRPPDLGEAHQRLVTLVESQFPGERNWDLSLGCAYQSDLEADFLDDLVRRADEDMYRRRGRESVS